MRLMSKIFIFVAWSILIFFIFLFLSNKSNFYHSDNIQNKKILELARKTKNYSKKIPTFESDSNSIVHISASPKILQPGNNDWQVTWFTNPINLAPNSWIGSYLYGQVVASDNHLSFFNLKGRKQGSDNLKVPKEAGLYDIKYIMDNNLAPLATTGPYLVSPSDIELNILNEAKPNEILSVEWKISEKSLEKFKENPLGTFLCLNLVGIYENCVWSKQINYSGKEDIKMPVVAGYYILRILVKSDRDRIQMECMAVSNLFKSSNPEIQLNSIEKTEVASALSVNWSYSFPEKFDWIGLFSLAEFNFFYETSKPLQSTKINGKTKGLFNTYLPPNSYSGQFIFAYFKNFVPIAVSNLINTQQPQVNCPAQKKTMSEIKHIIIICTENHSFDSYYGSYCKATENSNPKCNDGSKCCEKSPDKVEGQIPFVLDDAQNLKYDPNHDNKCEVCEINGGKMDGYIKGCFCSDPQNFAVADTKSVSIIHEYAEKYALADRYFQPTAGASSMNDMYFARAHHVYVDNEKVPSGSIGTNCIFFKNKSSSSFGMYYDPSITTLLDSCNFVLKSYAEGYDKAKKDFMNNPCYPNGYDSGDIPYLYYAGITDNPKYISDYTELKKDIENAELPDISFVKPLGVNTGHPSDANITNEMNFIKETVEMILNSKYYADTLIVWVPDESGGFYDHISPPATNIADGKQYGPRIPFLAFGKFAKKNYVSHVTMEHSSIVKFIEWNWLNGETGQLNTRDKNVNSIGDMIDPNVAGRHIP